MSLTGEDRPRTRVLVWAQLHLASDLREAPIEAQMLEDLNSGERYEVEVKADEPWEDLESAIRDFDPHVFHFIGHGKRGNLEVARHDDQGWPIASTVTPRELHAALRDAQSLSGVFLNGCETSQWAPHLIPPGGWFIGANRKVDDAGARLFAEKFYDQFETQSTNRNAFDVALAHVASTSGHSQPPIVRWVEDPDPKEFIHKVFDREAFRASVGRESSMHELRDALRGITKSLRRGRLITREDLGTASVVHCTEPLDPRAVDAIRHRMRAVNFDFGQLAREFSYIPDLGSSLDRIPQRDRRRFLRLADRLDDSRNETINAVNELLPLSLWLPEVELTPSGLGPDWVNHGPE
ncbi:CHAT domain-containing protein [Microbacterium oxydans]|uniref:CHAT domain-containing protein n=1 Tax=Microbacterium oxydans TaxID=82380 RepID=UPI0024ACC8F8|nr:CHAT domain-containing protein [Microbacterium oxydans]